MAKKNKTKKQKNNIRKSGDAVERATNVKKSSKASNANKKNRKKVLAYVGIGVVAVIVIVFLIMSLVLTVNNAKYGKEGETIDLTTTTFDKQINYTDERSFSINYYSFFTDLEGNAVPAPEGVTIEPEYAIYNIGEVTSELSDNGAYVDVVINYNLSVKSDFTYTKGSDFPEDIGWRGYYNEFFVFDTNTGKILNTDDITVGEHDQGYQYNLVTEEGIYKVGVRSSKTTCDDSYSDWEEVSEGLFEFVADDDYGVTLYVRYPAGYDGLAIALCKQPTDTYENETRLQKPMYFLEDSADSIDNYYVIKISDLLNEQ